MSDTVELVEPIGVLMNILKRHADKNRRRPDMFPSTIREAAQYWIDQQEAPDDYKEAVREVRQNGQLIAYETPYHDRLARNLRKFLGMKSIHQTYIIEHIQRDIPWRGDDMNMYTEIVRESEKMQADPEAYREKALKALSGFLRA